MYQTEVSDRARPGRVNSATWDYMWPPTSEGHNSFVRTLFRVFLDSVEIPLSLESNHMIFNGIWYPNMENMIVVPSVQIAWVKSIGIHDKKRDRYEQEIAIYFDMSWSIEEKNKMIRYEKYRKYIKVQVKRTRIEMYMYMS